MKLCNCVAGTLRAQCKAMVSIYLTRNYAENIAWHCIEFIIHENNYFQSVLFCVIFSIFEIIIFPIDIVIHTGSIYINWILITYGVFINLFICSYHFHYIIHFPNGIITRLPLNNANFILRNNNINDSVFSKCMLLALSAIILH